MWAVGSIAQNNLIQFCLEPAVAIEYDEIGIWSEVKLAIIKKYASAYAKIMEAQRREKIQSLRWIYIDAYAGPGYHFSKTSGERVDGSPLIALKTNPPFFEYHFIDTDERRAEQLRELAGDRPSSSTARTAIRFCCRMCFHGPSMRITGGRSACWTHTIST